MAWLLIPEFLIDYMDQYLVKDVILSCRSTGEIDRTRIFGIIKAYATFTHTRIDTRTSVRIMSLSTDSCSYHIRFMSVTVSRAKFVRVDYFETVKITDTDKCPYQIRIASLSRPYHARIMSVFHSGCPCHGRVISALLACCPCHIRLSSVSCSATSVFHPALICGMTVFYPWALSVSRPAVNLVEMWGVVRHVQQLSGVRVGSVYV